MIKTSMNFVQSQENRSHYIAFIAEKHVDDIATKFKGDLEDETDKDVPKETDKLTKMQIWKNEVDKSNVPPEKPPMSGTVEVNKISPKLPNTTRLSVKHFHGNLVFTPKIVAELCQDEIFDYPIDSLTKYNQEYNKLRNQKNNESEKRFGPDFSEVEFCEEKIKKVHFGVDEKRDMFGYYKVDCMVGRLKVTAVDKNRENVKKLAAQAVLKTLLAADCE